MTVLRSETSLDNQTRGVANRLPRCLCQYWLATRIFWKKLNLDS